MKKFRLQDSSGNDALGGEVSLDNAYISGYGSLRPGDKAPADLEAGELCHKTFALSGQRPTEYVIVRTE